MDMKHFKTKATEDGYIVTYRGETVHEWKVQPDVFRGPHLVRDHEKLGNTVIRNIRQGCITSEIVRLVAEIDARKKGAQGALDMGGKLV